MKVFYLTTNNGDGSSSVQFFKNEETAQQLLSDDGDLEAYGCNEGQVYSFEINGDNIVTNIDFFEDEKVPA